MTNNELMTQCQIEIIRALCPDYKNLLSVHVTIIHCKERYYTITVIDKKGKKERLTNWIINKSFLPIFKEKHAQLILLLKDPNLRIEQFADFDKADF